MKKKPGLVSLEAGWKARWKSGLFPRFPMHVIHLSILILSYRPDIL